jgi:hypothetical protein
MNCEQNCEQPTPTIEILRLPTRSVLKISQHNIVWEVPVHPFLPLAQQKTELVKKFQDHLQNIGAGKERVW